MVPSLLPSLAMVLGSDNLCILHVFGKTQPLRIYVRLMICIILQIMSKYSAEYAKTFGRFLLCSVVIPPVLK